MLAAEIAPTIFRSDGILPERPGAVSAFLALPFSFLNGKDKLDDGRLPLGLEDGEVFQVVLKAAKPAL